MKYHRIAFERVSCALAFGVLVALLWMPALALAQVELLTDAKVAQIPAGPQPIRFSHQIHAGQDLISCEYCHIYARRSDVAGVPPVRICMGCHQLVGQQLMEVQKVVKYWTDQTPIPWVKIFDVPDFVRFAHFKHVTANNEVYPNGVQCQTCHGPIETMPTTVKQDANFGTMGWCLQCHLTIPGMMERKRAEPASEGSAFLKNAKTPKGHYRPHLTDCLTCHK
ncbi:MAG: cytochrome c3 family protein [Candidatus Lambdaproteobacteria bacterium]|nr:cytochrome c3 family protein [Candidatus Lambdaproteobacteria bacterium]